VSTIIAAGPYSAYPAATWRAPGCRKSSSVGSRTPSGARSTEKIVPTVTLTSRFDEPSSGSNASRYRPRGYMPGIAYGPSSSSDTMPASWPPHSQLRSMMSFAMASSFCCASPCTFVVPSAPFAPRSGPRATADAMYLHAVWISFNSAVSSVSEPGVARCSSMMNFDNVGRPLYMPPSP
jgi:hypothetical protein